MEAELALAEHDPRRPFSFPKPARQEPAPATVRVPSIAEVPGLLEAWALAFIQRIYPRAAKMPVAQLLRHAATGAQNPPMRLLRTENALGFAVAERDALEPSWVVRVRFVVDRDAPVEAELVRAALHDWARTTVGAISVVDDDVTATAASEQPTAAVKRPAKPRAKRAKVRIKRSRPAAAAQSLADQSQEDPERQALSSVA